MNSKIRNILFTTLTLLLFSCEGDDRISGMRIGGTLSASVNGTIYSSSRNYASAEEGILSLTSEIGGNDVFWIWIESGIAETTYDIDATKAQLYFKPDDGESYFVTGSSAYGELIVTEIDEQNETISGTFSGVLQRYGSPGDLKTVSNGTFTDVPYELSIEAKGNVLAAKIDGVDFKGALSGSWGGYGVNVRWTNGSKNLNLYVPQDATPGTYNWGAFADPYFLVFHDGIHSYVSESGSVTITSNEGGRMVGTFTAGIDSYPVSGTNRTITNGSFDVHYDN